MRIAIIAENICDTDTTKNLIHKILGTIPVERRPTRGPIINKLSSRIQELSSRYSDLKAIILLEDLDNKNCINKIKALREEIGNASKYPLIIQLAIQKIEAWYLAMPEAVDNAFPNIRPFPRPKALTDNINDPKKRIKEIFRNKLGRDYRVTTDGPKISENFKINQNIVYMNHSFMRFLKKITSLKN